VFSVLALLLLVQPVHGAALACVAANLSHTSQNAKPNGASTEDHAADDCCPDEKDSRSDGESHENCPCPFPCASGCGGQPRGLVPTMTLPELVPYSEISVFLPAPQSTPPNPEPLGIMHVPKLR
jgi:hypothetical protein